MKLENLTKQEREELGQHYVEKYGHAFTPIVKMVAELVHAKDQVGLLFIQESISALLLNAHDQIEKGLDLDLPGTIGGWPVGTA